MGDALLTVYGIRQCDTCRKVLKWLEARNIAHRFHDFRVDGLDDVMLDTWLQSAFSEQLINRRSTSWRTLADERKAVAGDDLKKLLLEIPTLIKRPVFTLDSTIVAVGFRPDELTGMI